MIAMMTLVDYVALTVIFLLSTLLGYFLNQALQKYKEEVYKNNLKEQSELKNKLFETEKNLIILQKDYKNILESEAKIKQEFFQLTLAYKELQDEFNRKEEELLNKDYDVPPEFQRLDESNKMLAAEIHRLRSKIKKWQSKDFYKENKSLTKKLKKAKVKQLAAEQKANDQTKLAKYEELYNRIQSLSNDSSILLEEAKNIEKERTEIVEKPVQPKEKIKLEKPVNIFSKQPEFKKAQIFKEIISSEIYPTNPEPENTFDLDESDNFIPEEKNLMDLVDLDAKVYAVLLSSEINTFETLAKTSTKQLRKILEKSGLNPEAYQYLSWPLQANLALKGRWNIIEEYKKNK